MMLILRVLRFVLQWVVVVVLATSIGFTLLYKWLPVTLTPLMMIRCAQQMSRGETIRLKHHWVPIEEMSDQLLVAVMASEDQRFLSHHGFDFVEINKSFDKHRKGGRLRGASTISQQTAKNVFLWPRSSWLRKGLEVYFTALIELCWSKHRIMEVYLNSIEMGDGIYGAEAVAQQHFGCRAKNLTANQCALIAATLPNPLRYSSKNPSRYMLKRQFSIMKEMKTVSWQ